MSVRTKMIRKWRKNVLRNGENVKARILNTDDDGTIWPKEEWGYCINFNCNGYHCSCPDDSWYSAWQAANMLVKVCLEEPAQKLVCEEILPKATFYG